MQKLVLTSLVIFQPGWVTGRLIVIRLWRSFPIADDKTRTPSPDPHRASTALSLFGECHLLGLYPGVQIA